MTQAVAVRRDGDTFQARQFWWRAANLLNPQSPVIQVGFESGPKGFDDIWVAYDPAKPVHDHNGQRLLREHIQCKWHVSLNDFGYADLTSPDWINATTTSLLQRARAAQVVHAPEGVGVRFKLITNWRVAQNDRLRELIFQGSKTIRTKDLFDGGSDRTWRGQIRKLWRDHLGIDDKELEYLARTLAIDTDATSLDDHREHLNNLFEARGLARVPETESSFRYDDIAYKWLAQGRLDFNRDSFLDAVKREGLLQGPQKHHVAFGVKSFEHPFDKLEDRCTEVLDLTASFDDRRIRDQAEWESSLYPQLSSFLLAAGKSNVSLRLVMDTHVTLAYAAGSVLNIKSGRHVEIEQRTLGSTIWSATDSQPDPAWSIWEFEHLSLGDPSAGMAIAVGLTHDITADVQRYLASDEQPMGLLLVAKPKGGAGALVVKSGRHAFALAETLAQEINARRPVERPDLHLFVAAPNAFTFFLGQRQTSLGRNTLYEFDFDGSNGRNYKPSLALPVTPV